MEQTGRNKDTTDYINYTPFNNDKTGVRLRLDYECGKDGDLRIVKK